MCGKILYIIKRMMINKCKIGINFCWLCVLFLLLLIDRNLLIFVVCICWMFLKVWYMLIFVIFFLFFLSSFLILIVVVEMYWYFFKDGWWKNWRSVDIVFLSCFWDILNWFVCVKLIFCIMWIVFRCLILIMKYW